MAGTSFGETLAALAAAAPQAPLVTSGDSTRTRAEFDARTNRLARAFAARGVTAESFVTIALPNGVEFVEAMFAAWKLGATPQPISARLPAAERDAIVALARPPLVIDAPLPEAELMAADATPLPPRIASQFKAPTSGGSTGRPKLIVGTQPATLEAMAGYAALLGLPEDDAVLIPGPLYHNAPFTSLAIALLRGNHVVVMPRFDAQATLELVARHRASWMVAVPTMMHRIWRLPAAGRDTFDLSSLRTVLHTGAPCPPWLKREWIGWLGGERVVELYGGTEAQALATITGTDWLAHPGSVGRVAVGEMRIMNREGRALPPGEIGEVWMRRGAQAEPTYRYLGADAKTCPAAPGEAPWESLGDIGHFDADGWLYLHDRDSDMILVGGANVYPAEVEAAIDEFPGVGSSCVIGLPDDEYGSVVHAIVQAAALDEAALRAHLAARLGRYKLPRTIEVVTEPLRADDGKVRRSALRAARVAGAR